MIEHGPLASREHPNVAAALRDLFLDEGIDVLLDAKTRRVEGHFGVRAYVNDERGDRAIEGSDILVATGRRANTDGIGLESSSGCAGQRRAQIELRAKVTRTQSPDLAAEWSRCDSGHRA